MESVRNYLLSHKQSQKTYFNKAHGPCDLLVQDPGQEVLFQSPVENKYISGTITDRATTPCSYIIEVQGKRYCRMKEHLWPIHLNLPTPANPQPLPPKPKVPISCIPKPNPKFKHFPTLSHYQALSVPSLSYTPSTPAPIGLPWSLRLMQPHPLKIYCNTHPSKPLPSANPTCHTGGSCSREPCFAT